MSAYSISLTLFLTYKKIAKVPICLNLQTLELQVAQEQRKSTEECGEKILLIKEQRKLSQLNEALFPQFLQQTYQVEKPNKMQ